MNNQFSLEDKTILVTGASSGIGRDVAICCSKLGARVVVTGRNQDRLKNTYDALLPIDGNKCVSADLCDDNGIDLLVGSVEAVDGIVYCAGINDKYIVKAIDRDKIEKMFNTNVYAPILLTKELVKKKKINKNASIVFISSVSSTYATISNSLYAATKGAVDSLVRVWALEFASKKIRVNAVRPGMVNTEMVKSYQLSDDELQEVRNGYPLGRFGETMDIVNAVVYFLSNASEWTTGASLVVDGGVTLR